MYRVTFPVPQPFAGFDLSRPFGDRHPISQLPPPVVASIAFTVALWTVPKIRIQLAATPFVGSNKPINPLMTDRLIRPLLLQPMSNLFRAHPMLEPYRQVMAQPDERLAKLARSGSPGITFMGRTNRQVTLFRAVTANLTADRRRMHTHLFSNASLALFSPQACLNLVTLALSQLPVRRGHLRLNPWCESLDSTGGWLSASRFKRCTYSMNSGN